MSDLTELQSKFRGQHVCIAGNGPTVNMLTADTKGLLATVNGGLKYFDALDRDVDLYWVQDRRFLIDKEQLVKPYLHRIRHAAYSDDISYFRARQQIETTSVRMLGYEGFSKDASVGVFHGFNAIAGLLQVLYSLEVSSVALYGVGLKYFSNDVRFYQATRGKDTDLHRTAEQVSAVTSALQHFEDAGIGVEVVGPSVLTRASWLSASQS